MKNRNDNTESLKILRGGTMSLNGDEEPRKLLEAFPNQFPERLYIINMIFPEFTSLCPVTGQPDFGTIILEYIPDKLCVESKSFKLYLFSYRNRGSFMETITNSILNDVCELLQPCWARVQGLFAPRGGTRINVFAEEFSNEMPEEKKSQLIPVLAAWRAEQHFQDHPLR